MALINIENRSPRGKGGPPVTNTGINTAGITGWNFDRVIIVTPLLAATLKVQPGAYEHVSEDSSGNWTYAPYNRNV